MKFYDERIQKHLLSGGKIIRVNKNHDYRPIILGDNSYEYADNGDYYQLDRKDLESDDWVIIDPEYDWDKIIEDKILCVFSDYRDFKNNTLSTLRHKDEEFYYTEDRKIYSYCKPLNLKEYNVAKDLKEYEI